MKKDIKSKEQYAEIIANATEVIGQTVLAYANQYTHNNISKAVRELHEILVATGRVNITARSLKNVALIYKKRQELIKENSKISVDLLKTEIKLAKMSDGAIHALPSDPQEAIDVISLSTQEIPTEKEIKKQIKKYPPLKSAEEICAEYTRGTRKQNGELDKQAINEYIYSIIDFPEGTIVADIFEQLKLYKRS